MIKNKKILGIGKIQNSAIIPQPKVLELAKYNSWEYWPFGVDNLFPDQLAFLNRTSPTHMGIINSKTRYFTADTHEFKGVSNKAVNDWLINPNSRRNYSQAKLRADFFKSWQDNGNLYIELVRDKKNSFINTYIKDFTKCRLGNKKFEGQVIICDNWQYFQELKTEAKVIPIYPEWGVDEGGLLHSVVVIKNEMAGYNPYGLSDWLAGLDCAETLKGINTWNKSRVKSGFASDGAFISEFESAKEADEAEEKFKESKSGDEKAGNIIFIKKGVGGATSEFIQFNRTADGEFITLRDISVTDLIMSHGWFRSLCSIPDNTGFDTNRILNEYALALPSQILPAQEFFLETFDNLFKEIFNTEIRPSYEFINYPPIKDKNVRMIWEIRRDQGDTFDENDPLQQRYYGEISVKKEAI